MQLIGGCNLSAIRRLGRGIEFAGELFFPFAVEQADTNV